MNIRFAIKDDFNILCEYDKHISPHELTRSIDSNHIYIAEENGEFVGWLRYGLFWDNTPFMNMLYILEDYRGKGCGRQLTNLWETHMKQQGFSVVMTSTVSSEYAQHFYNRLGYKTIGGFTLPKDEYEIIMCKEI